MTREKLYKNITNGKYCDSDNIIICSKCPLYNNECKSHEELKKSGSISTILGCFYSKKCPTTGLYKFYKSYKLEMIEEILK